MTLHYHADTDSLYIALSPKPSADSDEVAEGVVLDFDAEGRLVDIDNASHKLALPAFGGPFRSPMNDYWMTNKTM